MDTIFTTGIEKDVDLLGYNYLLHDGQYYRGCRRCGGSGHYSFDGYSSECYECGNTSARYGVCVGTLEEATKDAEKRAKAKAARDAKRQREYQKKVDAAQALRDELKASDPDVYDFLMGISIDTVDEYDDGSKLEKNQFIRAMAETLRWVGQSRRFTPNMIAAVRKAMETRAAKAVVNAAKAPVVEGRRVITGKVISTKVVEGDYGTTYKFLVEEEGGARVFGSIAKDLWNQVEFMGQYRMQYWNESEGVMAKLVGMEVTFTATVQVSKDDKSFGFFSRPTKASVVE